MGYPIFGSRDIEMINRLQIKNFRAHKKLDIKFSPFVNSIVGRNAAGKSTIIRAIRWVTRNKPAGDSVINWDADKAAVRLTIDKNKITRTRGKGINTYKLNKKKPYKAFRNEVPTDIEKITNISDLNFQGQHEAPFWFCETAGEVSRQLNTIVNLEGIDSTLSNIASALTKSRTTVDIIQDRLDKATAQQDSLSYAKEMDEHLKQVESIEQSQLDKTAELTRLHDILKLVQICRDKWKNTRELTRDSKLALSKGQLYAKITVRIENLEKTVELGESLLVVINKKPLSLNHLKSLKRKQETMVSQYDALKELVFTLEKNRESKWQTEKELKKCKEELNKIVEGRCPLCGAKMKKS